MADYLYKGIDVSHHNGVVDWNSVKKSGKVQFALLRAGFGKELSQKDTQFENNYIGCKTNSIPCGVYWYSYADSVENALEEAKTCVQVIKGKEFEYPVFLDIEEGSQVKLGKEICSEICRTFCDYIESQGYYAGIYTFDSFAETNISDEIKNRYSMAIARIGDSPKHSPYALWQYSWKGQIDGIKGSVDLDYCYTDFEKIIKEKGFNGYGKSDSGYDPKYDVNGDGKITAEDALEVLEHIVE